MTKYDKGSAATAGAGEDCRRRRPPRGHGLPEEPPEVTYPESAEALTQVIDWTLHHHFGRRVERDVDGDFPIESGVATVYVQMLEHRPALRLYAPLVTDIRDSGQAVAAALALNAGPANFRFVLADDLLYVTVHIPARPFVPAHLREQLASLTWYLDDVLDPSLADRLRGNTAVDTDDEADEDDEDDEDEQDDEDDEDEQDEDDHDDEDEQDWLREGGGSVETALLILAQLSYDGAHGLSAQQVARLFADDQESVLRGIRDCEEQEIAWRRSAESARANGEADEAQVCAVESAAAAKTAKDLRGALRYIVTRPHPIEEPELVPNGGTDE